MSIVDSKDRIARSNVYSIMGNMLNKQISDNHDGEIFLRKTGLSSYWEEYSVYLTPTMDNKWADPNPKYNTEYVCIKICEDIENDEETLLRFLNQILEGINIISDNIIEKLSNYLEVIGYELMITENEEYSYCDAYNYTLVPITKGTCQRNSDVDFLYSMIKNKHSDLLQLYDEAISNYGAGQYISCIDTCRSLFESFFKKLDTSGGNYVKGLLAATGEIVKDENGNEITSAKKIYEYWLKTNKGGNRFRLFHTMYSMMSGLGVHNEDSASKEDALLILRYVEDCLLWCFRKGVNC